MYIKTNYYFRTLLSQLEQFKSSINDQPESEEETGGSGIVYQFNYRPEHARLAQTTRVADLESRLHKLEAVIGEPSEKLARLTAGTVKGKKRYKINVKHIRLFKF